MGEGAVETVESVLYWLTKLEDLTLIPAPVQKAGIGCTL